MPMKAATGNPLSSPGSEVLVDADAVTTGVAVGAGVVVRVDVGGMAVDVGNGVPVDGTLVDVAVGHGVLVLTVNSNGLGVEVAAGTVVAVTG